ncbi:MAG: N-acetyltransferase [Myxococcales bacterium]|nr:N-acetyltransferase [Myxococcales bacterium]
MVDPPARHPRPDRGLGRRDDRGRARRYQHRRLHRRVGRPGHRQGGLLAGAGAGFILHPGHHRRGLASEALTALLDRAFSVRLMPRVVVDVDPKNHACLALVARRGFQEFDRASRTFCRGGGWSDSVILELAAARWQSPGPWMR